MAWEQATHKRAIAQAFSNAGRPRAPGIGDDVDGHTVTTIEFLRTFCVGIRRCCGSLPDRHFARVGGMHRSGAHHEKARMMIAHGRRVPTNKSRFRLDILNLG